MQSDTRLPKVFLAQVNKFTDSSNGTIIRYDMENVASTAYLLLNLIYTHPEVCTVDDKTFDFIKERAKVISDPTIVLDDDTHIGINIPMLPFYLGIMQTVSAVQKTYTYYTVPFTRAFDVVRLLVNLKTFLPAFKLSPQANEVFRTFPMNHDNVYDMYKTDVANLMSVHYAYKANEENFHNAKYLTISDLLNTQPMRYVDKTAITTKLTWKKNDPVIIMGRITDIQEIKGQHAKFYVTASNLNGMKIEAMFYRRIWIARKFRVGEEVLLMGKFYYGNMITGETVDSLAEAANIPIVPIYSQSPKNGITTRLLMSATHEALDRLSLPGHDIAPYFDDTPYMSMLDAYTELHFPTNIHNYKIALKTLAFYELVYMQLQIQHKKMTTEKAQGISKKRVAGKAYDKALEGLPFDLTEYQKSALNKIDSKLSSPSAEQLLLSADVGAGKTLVAQLTCLQAVDAGYQAVLAAPTEVLAQQLYNTFKRLLDGIPASIRPSIAYMSGRTKQKAKENILKSIEYGETSIIVGTHSVLSSKVPYKNLGVICIDEQQKFGSGQREELLKPGRNGGVPDLLTQTATPIPRSTAQAMYGDIDVITMDGRPEGRHPIDTQWIKEDPDKYISKKTTPMMKDIAAEVEAGHKVFVVVPMVYDNAKVSASSVQTTYKTLQKKFPDWDIEYAHGQMKPESQDKHIKHFRDKGDVLVASTIIEVGIDVPEATRMVILSADRLGASSLHQIRGRVGRNDLPSKCYLVSDNDSDKSEARLQALVDTQNGFKIAEIDLKTRGQGNLFGLKQAGDSQFNFLSQVDHTELIKPAHELAMKIYNGKYQKAALKDAYYSLSMDKEED